MASATTKSIHFVLRDETRPNERRTPLTPADAKFLLQNPAYTIDVEESTQRIFATKEYEEVGCKVIPSQTWTLLDTRDERKNNDKATFVLGLKELPLEGEEVPNKSISVPRKLPQRHIYFAHCFKGQATWKNTLSRFTDADGELLDLEFLQLDSGRRIAAFGYAAGFAGMAVGLLQWAHQKKGGKVMSKLIPYDNKDKLIQHVKDEIQQVGYQPTVLVLGAKGRCGQGSVAMAKAAGIEKIVEWDIEETKGGGPFKQLLDVDVLVNDIYLMGKIPPFVTKEMIHEADEKQGRKLTVFVDVSCDVGNPNNPFPLVDDVTSFDVPSLRIVEEDKEKKVQPLDVIAIDHLPSLTPRESSADYSSFLVQHLKNLHLVDWTEPLTSEFDVKKGTEEQRVWTRARSLYKQKWEELQASQ